MLGNRFFSRYQKYLLKQLVLFICMMFFINFSDSSGTTGDTLYCYPACDWLAGLGGTYPYQEPHGFIKETYYPELDYQNSYGIHTKFNNELLTVYIKSNKQTNAKLSIIDLQGRELLLKNTDLYSGVNQLSINLNDLTSGIYIYSLEIDGIRIKTDKISIAK